MRFIREIRYLSSWLSIGFGIALSPSTYAQQQVFQVVESNHEVGIVEWSRNTSNSMTYIDVNWKLRASDAGIRRRVKSNISWIIDSDGEIHVRGRSVRSRRVLDAQFHSIALAKTTVDHPFAWTKMLWEKDNRILLMPDFVDGRIKRARLSKCVSTLSDNEFCISRQWLDGAKISEQWWLDANHGVRAIDLELLGRPVQLRICDPSCSKLPRARLDLLHPYLVVSPFRISRKQANGTLRYVLHNSDDAIMPPITSEQDVRSIGNRHVVTICDDCGNDTEIPSQANLLSNRWIDFKQKNLAYWIRTEIPKNLSSENTLRRAVKILRSELNQGFSSLEHDSASRALDKKRGDCEEFALLLAAIARAHGIPARLAFGVAYNSRFTGQKDVFSPHIWVQVWIDGRWKSFDAALEYFDATHIALATSATIDAKGAAVLEGLKSLRIEKIGQVERAR